MNIFTFVLLLILIFLVLFDSALQFFDLHSIEMEVRRLFVGQILIFILYFVLIVRLILKQYLFLHLLWVANIAFAI